jgi:hypothetical protein
LGFVVGGWKSEERDYHRRLDESEADEKFKIEEEEERCQDTVNIGSSLAELLMSNVGIGRRGQREVDEQGGGGLSSKEGESSLFSKSGKLGFWAARWGKLSEGPCQIVQGVGSRTGSYPQLKGRLVSGHAEGGHAEDAKSAVRGIRPQKMEQGGVKKTGLPSLCMEGRFDFPGLVFKPFRVD